MNRFAALLVIGCAVVAGCDGGTSGSGGAGGSGGQTTTETTGEGGAPTGLPCDVAALLQQHCWSCHGPVPGYGVPLSLVTREQFAAKTKNDATKTNAEMSLLRMTNPASPMPPAPAAMVSAAEAAVFQAWIAGGLAHGTCAYEGP